MANLTPSAKLTAAVARATDGKIGYAPYLASALQLYVRRESSEIPTMALTRKGVLLWNSAFVEASTVQDLALALLHETLHGILDFHGRAEALGATADQLDTANLAHDACINESLHEMSRGATPTDWIYPATLQQPPKLVFEARYHLLRQQQQRPQTKAQPGHGRCGSCGGKPLPGEPADGGRTPREIRQMQRAVAQAVREHARNGSARGTIPADLVRWAEETLAPPVVDWRKHLSALVRDAIAYRPGAIDLTWRRPSRRQAGIGYGPGRPVVPGLHAPQPRVGVILDTSGSMGGPQLTAVVAEIQGVLRQANASIYLAVVDAALHFAGKVSTITGVRQAMRGGGGTNLLPAFEALAHERVDVVVVCTDGYIGDTYPTKTHYKTVWCIVGNDSFEAPYGTRVNVPSVGGAS